MDISRPNRSDVHLSGEEEAKAAAAARDYFDGVAPKRHSKPQRSEYSTAYADALSSDDQPNPEFSQFQQLEKDTQKLVYSGSKPTEEFTETEYYRDLSEIDKQHHTISSERDNVNRLKQEIEQLSQKLSQAQTLLEEKDTLLCQLRSGAQAASISASMSSETHVNSASQMEEREKSLTVDSPQVVKSWASETTVHDKADEIRSGGTHQHCGHDSVAGYGPLIQQHQHQEMQPSIVELKSCLLSGTANLIVCSLRRHTLKRRLMKCARNGRNVFKSIYMNIRLRWRQNHCRISFVGDLR